MTMTTVSSVRWKSNLDILPDGRRVPLWLFVHSGYSHHNEMYELERSYFLFSLGTFLSTCFYLHACIMQERALDRVH